MTSHYNSKLKIQKCKGIYLQCSIIIQTKRSKKMSKANYHKAMMSGSGQCPIDKNYHGPLDRHHINGRSVKNWDSSWNVVYVSPNVHRQIHEGEIVIEGWFSSTEGRTLMWHKKGQESSTGVESTPHIISRKTIPFKKKSS